MTLLPPLPSSFFFFFIILQVYLTMNTAQKSLLSISDSVPQFIFCTLFIERSFFIFGRENYIMHMFYKEHATEFQLQDLYLLSPI